MSLKFLYTTCACFNLFISIAQPNEIRPLKIGDKVPDIFLGKVIGHPNLKEARMTDFKGKLIILDFWSVSCSFCIQLFPKLYELQQAFPENLMILPVGFDSGNEGSIQSFYNKVKGTSREIKLPTIIQGDRDTILTRLFPFRGMPHEVWINPDGVIIGITNHLAVTKQNIEDILNGKELKFSIKKQRKLISSSNFLLNSPYVYGSAFSGYCDSLISYSTLSDILGGSLNIDISRRHIFDINRPVTEYYRNAYACYLRELNAKKYSQTINYLLRYINPINKTIFIDPKSKDFYKYEEYYNAGTVDNWQYDQFAEENLFCYQLNLPKTYSKLDVFKRMINDLDEFFKIKSQLIEKEVQYNVDLKQAKQKITVISLCRY